VTFFIEVLQVKAAAPYTAAFFIPSHNRPVLLFADDFSIGLTAVPAPAAIWLFGSGFTGLIGMARRRKAS